MAILLQFLTSGLLFALVSGEENFCSQNLIDSNYTGLDWTKEINTIDFVVLERYKTLSCCAKNYEKIVWFKDNKPIRTHQEFPTFNELHEKGQTLVSKSAKESDAGTYTCRAYDKNNRTIEKDIRLETRPQEKYMGRALLMYPNWDDLEKDERTGRHIWKEYAEIGDKKRLFCEAFIGVGNEHVSQVVWVFANHTFAESKLPDGHRFTNKTWRDNKIIIGLYLYFNPVMKEDFTSYLCSVSNGHEPIMVEATLIEGVDPKNLRMSYKPTLIIIAVFLCISAFVLTVYTRWHLEIKLFWKDRFGKIEDDNKEYDVFVCYDQKDADFALGVLVHVLEEVYKYKCFAYERDSIAGEWIPEIYTMKIKSSRRFMMVLSQALASNSWCTYALYIAIEAMLNLHSKIICIQLQDIKWDEIHSPTNEAIDVTLQQILKVVRKVRWKPAPQDAHSNVIELFDVDSSQKHLYSSRSILDSDSMCEEVNYGSEKFWTALRIHLPPKRHFDGRPPS